MGTKRGTREIPLRLREALAEHVEAWIAEQRKREKLTERQLAPRLGISQATLNEIRNKKGPLGLHVLLALSEKTGSSIDSLLTPMSEAHSASNAPGASTQAPGISAAQVEAAVSRALLKHLPPGAPRGRKPKPPISLDAWRELTTPVTSDEARQVREAAIVDIDRELDAQYLAGCSFCEGFAVTTIREARPGTTFTCVDCQRTFPYDGPDQFADLLKIRAGIRKSLGK